MSEQKAGVETHHRADPNALKFRVGWRGRLSRYVSQRYQQHRQSFVALSRYLKAKALLQLLKSRYLLSRTSRRSKRATAKTIGTVLGVAVASCLFFLLPEKLPG